MILGRNVEQDEMMCWVQEWLSYFWTLNLNLCPLCNSNNLHNILMILHTNVNRTRQCVAYKNDNPDGVRAGGKRGRGWAFFLYFFF